MKILITGASGKIGKHIVNFFIKKKYFCYLNSRKKIHINTLQKNYANYRKDILSNSFKIPDCEAIIHTAAITPEKKNLKKVKLNRIIDKKIFNEIKKNKKLKKLIFISTASVYDKNNYKKQVNEISKRLANSEYSKYKLESEKMFLSNKKIETYNIRIPGLLLTGNENNFLSNLVKNIKNKKKLTLYNPDQMFNNLLLIQNLNLFIENLLINKFKSGTILLGSTNTLRLYEITKMISNYFKVKNYINWRIDKKRGFYLNINNALGNYNFSSINTQKGILEYLKKNYRK